MGIGSKTILAALGLMLLAQVQQEWSDCFTKGDRSSLVCLLKNSGEVLGEQLRHLRKPGR